MKKELLKSGNMLYPLPVVMVSCGNAENRPNIITVAWAGTICTNPAMLSISIRPERYSYGLIKQTKEFVVNMTNEFLVKSADYCGVKSGRDTNKFHDMQLSAVSAKYVSAPMIEESPVNIECRVKEIIKLGSHDMFLSEVLAVHVDQSYIDETGKIRLPDAKPIVYSHGEYYGLSKVLGKFGYSVKKKKDKNALSNSKNCHNT